MKRIVVLILAMLYFAVSSGFTVHVHYCMGHIVETTFVDDADDTHDCNHCGMKKKKSGNGCCKQEAKIVKHVADHSLIKEIKLQAPVFIALSVSFFCITQPIPLLTQEAGKAFQPHGPPEPSSCPVYLEIRDLRI